MPPERTHLTRPLRAGVSVILLAGLAPAAGAPQPGNVPLSPEAWTATDSIRFVSYLGRPALYLRRGAALARGASMENGTLEFDLTATDTTTFLGVVFRAAAPRFSNVLFLRPRASGTEEAVQYGPAFNGLGVAWQVYHGAGANTSPRPRGPRGPLQHLTRRRGRSSAGRSPARSRPPISPRRCCPTSTG